PGSTFKLVTALAALREGLINERTSFDDRGSLRVGNRTFRNAGEYPWGRVNVTRALAVSSDVFFYTLGASFWNQRGQYGETAIQDVAHELSMGDKTGIPLASEAKGRISGPEGRKRLHEQNPRAFPEGRWFAGDNVNLSIGQGETVVTPLQLGVSYATFANGGTVYQPQVAVRVLKQDGSVVREVPAVVTRRVDIPANVRNPILGGLRGAVTDPKGTAHGAFAGFSAFPVAGKTGTAQVSGKQDTAVFAAFAPANDPQYAISVVMEEAGFGGSVAAPVARRIFAGLAGNPVGPVELAGGVD
ncbi:MAG TPA: penicillin-binding transpeptidase domain-containing protein, partial [Acidimicrobiales bacterium]